MLRQLVNQCRLTVRLSTVGPMLIKAGAANTRDVEMAAVRTIRDGRDEVYLPGSSLKGVVRSHCERIARTLNDAGACDPLARTGPYRSCSDVLDEREHPRPGGQRPAGQGASGPAAAYRDSCPVCRIFGTSHISSRALFGDGLLAPESAPVVTIRDGIGIDRFTGGAASRVRYEAEVVTDATFLFDVVLRNFELAQLGLVWLALRDMMRGELRLGSGKSRGFGRARGELVSSDVAYVGPRPEEEAPALLGAGHVWRGAAAYGFPAEDIIAVEGASYERAGVWTHLRTSDQGLPWDAVERRAVAALEAYAPTPAALRARQPGGAAAGARGTPTPAAPRRAEPAPRPRIAATTRPVRGLQQAAPQAEGPAPSAAEPGLSGPDAGEAQTGVETPDHLDPDASESEGSLEQ